MQKCNKKNIELQICNIKDVSKIKIRFIIFCYIYNENNLVGRKRFYGQKRIPSIILAFTTLFFC